MPIRAPVPHHLDLYNYWLAKRGSRTMPARSDIDPADIPALLSYLTIIDKAGGQLRYRLFGTAVAREAGRDLTGRFVGCYVSDAPESAAALRAMYERVFTTARPVFASSKFHLKSGAIQSLSYLLLPLSDDGTQVNMIVSTLLARFDFDAEASFNWLKGLPIKVCDMINVCDAADLEKLCLEWDQRSLNRGTRPERRKWGPTTADVE
jgi:hypothetical protein